MSDQAITDETLVAYLDGQLPDAAHRAVDDALAADPALGERLEGLTLDHDALKAGFDDLLSQAPAFPVSAAPVAANTNRRPWRAAVVAAVFVGGMAAGWAVSLDRHAAWHQAVADYQVLYTTETLAAAPLDADSRAAGLARVAGRLDLPLDLETVAVDGMEFQRAQMLSHQGAPLAQLAFLDGNGAPIAFCIMRGDAETAREQIEIAGLNASTWAAGGYTYILIGPVAGSQLDAAANVLQSRMPG